MEKRFLSVKELGEYLHIKPATLYGKTEAGEVPHYKVGRLIRFKQDDIDEWMEKHRREPLDANKRARRILKATDRSNVDVNRIVKKSIEEVKGKCYSPGKGKLDQVKGLRKEVEDGTLS
jgi:excisionase family DNA binding protein